MDRPDTADLRRPTPTLAARADAAVSDERALQVEIVRDSAGLEALRPAWDALHAAVGADAGEAFNPFMSWAWMWHWWQSRARSSFAQPRYQLHVVVLRDEAETVRAIVPFVRARWGIGPLSVRALRLFGFGPTTADLRAPLVCPTWEASAADALGRLVDPGVGRRHDLTILDGIPETGQLPQRLAGLASVNGWTWGQAVPSHILPLPGTWETFRGGFKGHLKKSVRHGYNSLRRDGHEWAFEVVDEPAAMPAALDDLFRLHAARAARDLKPRHVDYYARPADRAALRSAAASMAASGSIALCRLRVGGSIVAARMVFRGRDAIYLHDAGADPTWSRYAVATTLTSECLRWAIGNGVTVAHLGTGDDPSKARWQGHQRWLRQLHVVAPTFAGRMLAAARHLPRVTRDLSMALIPWWSDLPFEALA